LRLQVTTEAWEQRMFAFGTTTMGCVIYVSPTDQHATTTTTAKHTTTFCFTRAS
jgi:hypothetical protein